MSAEEASVVKFPTVERMPNELVKLLLLGLVLGTGCTATPDLPTVNRLQEIQSAFDDATTPEDFLHVAAQYQELLDTGFVSGAVLFNQGNAYVRAGQRGRAVACYRRAQRYLPRDPYLDANLRYALAGSQTSRRSVLDYVIFWQDWISYPGKFFATGLAAAITFILGLLALLAKFGQLWKRFAWLTLLATLVLAASAAYDWYRYTQVRHGVIVRDEAVARKGDSESYEPAFTQPLSETTEVTVLETRGGWHRVQVAADQVGWVEANDVLVY